MAHRRLAAVVAEITGRQTREVRTLKGGISNSTYLVRLAPPGEPDSVVVRVFPTHDRASTEAAALQALEGSVVVAPKLLGTGRTKDRGWVVVSTRVPGRPGVRPDDPDWVDSLAAALRSVHATPRRGRGLETDPGSARRWLERPPSYELGPSARLLWPEIARRREELDGDHVLVHGDFHAGNVHWARGRVSGVIDWEMARWGPPAADIAYCYVDLCLAAGSRTAQHFLDAYVGRTADVQGFHAWLLLALLRPLPDPAAWLPSYEGAGWSGLTAGILRRRHRELVRRSV